ncbi:MAG: LCP family protein [Thermomicrobiales bacterium]
MRCPICNATVQPADQFCERCGAVLQTAPPASAEPFELPTSDETRRQGSSRRRSKRKKWYNRWPVRIAAALLLLIVGAAAFGAWRLDKTMGNLNAVSTLPAQIQDQTAQDVDGSPVPLVTVVLPTRNPDAPAPTVVIPHYEGASPGGPARQTAIAVVQEPQPTSTPQATTEAVAAAGAASPTPTIDGESQAESMMAAGMTFDTGPAQTAIAEAAQNKIAPVPTPTPGAGVFVHTAGSLQSTPTSDDDDDGDSGGILDGLRGAGGNVQDAAQGAAVAAGISDPKTDPMTILIMGVDARPGSAIDIGVRPDALMVLRLDPETGACRGLAIPRDSLVELPGYGETKINHALMLGGIPYEELVVELYLGIEIDHYALIDFTGFEDLVDAVGGVTITVPENLASPAVPAGTHTIDGATALRHARYRGGPDGDFGRIQRQQELIRALIATAGGRNLLAEANRLLPALEDNMRTDLSLDQLVALAQFYQGNCSSDGLTLQTIPGDVVYGPIIDPLFGLPLSYVVSTPEDVQAKVDELMGREDG